MLLKITKIYDSMFYLNILKYILSITNNFFQKMYYKVLGLQNCEDDTESS